MTTTSLEPRLAFIRDWAARGGFGATLAAGDAARIIEFALRELLRRHRGSLPADKQHQIEQSIQAATKGSRATGLADLTLGQLIGVIRDTGFFDAWSAATGKPLAALRLIDLNALTRFRNKDLMHLNDWDQVTATAAQVSPADAQFILHCLELLIDTFGILSLEDAPPEPDPELLAHLPPLAASPYLGLRAFGADQRDLFFGREDDVAQLLARVQGQPFVALIGNSGSGKSSLVAAGLIPGLPAADWLPLTLQPRDDLIERLAATLLPLLYPDPAEQAGEFQHLAERLAAPGYRLDHLLEGLPGRGARRLLLVVDQFEELFTLCADRKRQRQAADLLLSILHAGATGPLRLLIVLRADFYGQCLDLAPLQQALDRWPPLNLGPMGPESLLAAIVKPAEHADLSLEDGLAETIVRDLGDEPGHLPLLQTALDELWQRGDRRRLTHAGYRAIGGVSQALARKADAFLAGYNSAGRDQVRRIFVQLVRPGEGAEDTRQLATRAQVGADNWGLVTQLADARLLVTAQDQAGYETVQLAHEALIRHWQQLRDWINEDRAFRLWQNKLRESRADWAGHDRDEGYLLRGLRLAEAQERLAERGDWLDADERDYITASAAAQERERAEREVAALARQRAERRLIVGLSIGLVIALGLAGYAFRQQQVATLARNQAEDLINYMLGDLRAKLIPVGRVDLLESVAKKAEQYFEQLENADVSTESEHKRSVALYNIGEVYNAKGDLSKAMTAWKNGLAIAERLSKREPENTEWQFDLSKKHQWMGLLMQELGDLKGAVEHYNTSHAIIERLVQRDPNNIDWQLQLVGSLQAISTARFLQDDRTGAIATVEANVGNVERLVQRNPGNANLQFNLEILYRDLGDFRSAQGDLEGARTAYQRSQSTIEGLLQKDPENIQYQLEQGVLYERFGTVHLKVEGGLDAALAAFEASQRNAEQLAKRDPENLNFQHNLIIGYKKIGAVKGAQGRFDLAMVDLNRALDIAIQATQRAPNQTTLREDLSFVHQAIGEAQDTHGNRSEALAAYEAALKVQDRLAQQDPSNVAWQIGLSNIYRQIGEIKQAQEDLAGALTAYKANLGIAKKLAQRYPQDPDRQHNLSECYYTVGKVRQAQGDLFGALSAYKADLAISRDLAEKDPNDVDRQRSLAISYETIGEVTQAQGDLAGARESYEQELAIAVPLFERTKATEAPRFLGSVYERLATICSTQGDLKAALGYQRDRVAQVRRNDDPSGLAQALLMLSVFETQTGNDQAGLATITEAAKIAQGFYRSKPDDASRSLLAMTLSVRSYALLFNRQFKEASVAAEEALAVDPTKLWNATSQAHGYLLSGRFDQAQAIYRAHAKERLNDRQTFAEAVLDDFAQLRKRGIDHPDMKRIETMLKGGGKAPAGPKGRK